MSIVVSFVFIVYLKVMVIKDKYGRYIIGSDKEIKEVVDYVVFERYFINNYGVWKVCGKLYLLL